MSSAEPIANPTTVPARARHAVAPVEAALVRSTDSVPSTTQNPCCSPDTSAMATAAASATAPRSELRNQTERIVACRRISASAPATPVTALVLASISRVVWRRAQESGEDLEDPLLELLRRGASLQQDDFLTELRQQRNPADVASV